MILTSLYVYSSDILSYCSVFVMNICFIFSFRITLIQEAANKYQDFQNALQSMDFFLVNLPNNAIKPTDDVAQITAKQNSQKVRESISYLQIL